MMKRMGLLTRLPLHRTNTGVLKEQPVVDFVRLPGTLGEADPVLGIIAVYQVLHDASRLEEIDCLAIRERVSQGGYTAIRIDGTKPRFFLGVFANLDLVDLVGNAVDSSAPEMRMAELLGR